MEQPVWTWYPNRTSSLKYQITPFSPTFHDQKADSTNYSIHVHVVDAAVCCSSLSSPSPTLRQLSRLGAGDGADGVGIVLDLGVADDLVLVVADPSLRNGAGVGVVAALGRGVVGGQDGGDGPDDGTDLVVHLAALGLADDGLEGGAGLGVGGADGAGARGGGGGGARHRRVLG